MSGAHARRTSQEAPDGSRVRLAQDGCTRPTRTALQIAPNIPYASWRQVGSKLALIADSSSWWLGDWIVYGQGQFGKRYLEAIEATHLDYQTLRNYAWVARKFEPLRRRQTLSFQHHLEVAGLSVQDQDTWLDRAHLHSWSRTQLRTALRAARMQAAGTMPVAVSSVTINIDSNRHTRWAQAAAADAHDLSAWMIDMLDQAAARRLASDLLPDAVG